MKHNLTIGQTLYLVYSDPRRHKEPIEVTIASIGRKIAKLTGFHGNLNIEEMQQHTAEYTPAWSAYISLEKIADEKERKTLAKELDREIRWLSLEQLRAIKQIIDQQP